MLNLCLRTRDRCETIKQIRNTIEVNNVTIRNTGNVALNVNGCFNLFMCSNVTLRKENLFIFKGGVLNTSNSLTKNTITDNNVKYNEYVRKSLFLIDKSVAVIQKML